MPELFRGLGYPLLNFYSPFVYYLVEFFHLAGLDIAPAFVAAYVILVLAAGTGMYLFALSVFGAQRRWPALVAATAYMYAPYLLTNLYVRGAIAELGAQAWLPWVFWGTRRLLTAERPSQYVVVVALSMGGLAVTHNITLLFAPVVLGCYVLLLWWRTGRSAARLGWMALAIAAAVGISAFFWLPLMAERQYLAETAYQTTATALLMHSWTWRTFVNTSVVFELNGIVPFRLGLVQLVLALAGIIVAGRRDAEWLFFILLAVLTGLGISVWSVPVWLSSQDPAHRPVPLAAPDVHDPSPGPLHRRHPAASSTGQPPVCRRGCVDRFGHSYHPAAGRRDGGTGADLGIASRSITFPGSKTRRPRWAQAGARSSGRVGPRDPTTCRPLPIDSPAMLTSSSVRSMPTGSRPLSQLPLESRCASPACTSRAGASP